MKITFVRPSIFSLFFSFTALNPAFAAFDAHDPNSTPLPHPPQRKFSLHSLLNHPQSAPLKTTSSLGESKQTRPHSLTPRSSSSSFRRAPFLEPTPVVQNRNKQEVLKRKAPEIPPAYKARKGEDIASYQPSLSSFSHPFQPSQNDPTEENSALRLQKIMEKAQTNSNYHSVIDYGEHLVQRIYFQNNPDIRWKRNILINLADAYFEVGNYSPARKYYTLANELEELLIRICSEQIRREKE